MFRILPPLILKVLVPALLTVVLVIAGAVVSQSQVRSIPAVGKVVNVSQVDRSSVAGEVKPIRSKPQAVGEILSGLGLDRSSVAGEVKPIQSSPATEQKVDYDLIIKDIVQIFKWMETPGMTPIKLAAEIHRMSCDEDCGVNILTRNVFEDLASEKYLDKIYIAPRPSNNEVGKVYLDLKLNWNKLFYPEDFIANLSENSGLIRKENLGDRDCITSARDKECPRYYRYSVNIKSKYFRSSKLKEYRVYTEYFYFQKEQKILAGIELEIA
jgi:hypothetical protein